MWQDSGFRGYPNKQPQKKKPKKLLPKHMRRTTAQIKPSVPLGSKIAGGGPADIVLVRIVLNDFSAKGIELFSPKAMRVGQEVSMTMDDPKRFFSRARIVGCQEMRAETHILSAEKYNYRVRLQFLFDSSEQEESVRLYAEEIIGDCVGAPAVKKAA